MGSFTLIGPLTVTASDRATGAPNIPFSYPDGWYNTSTEASSDDDLIDALNTGVLRITSPNDTDPLIINSDISYGFNLTDACIVLDGGSPISYNELPTGFAIVTAIFIFNSCSITKANSSGESYTYSITAACGSKTATQNGTFTTPVPFTVPQISIDLTTFPALTMLDILNNGISCDVDISVPNGGYPHNWVDGAFLGSWSISGTYLALSLQYKLSQATQPVAPNTQVKITSDPNDPDHLKLNHLDPTTPITLQDDPTVPVIIISATEFELVFEIPDLSLYDPADPPVLTVQVVGDGTQFSGSVELGKLQTIYFLNAPGIYFLDKTATADTLYDTVNGGTIKVKIPDPTFKTGFIGG
jgi:hypothetical protein